jgi:hypothetical protein
MASITYSEKMAKNGVKMPYTRNCDDFIFEWLTNQEFLTELKESGYDVSTFKFSIQRGKKSQDKPLWKESYSIYKKEARMALMGLKKDKEWINKQIKYNPNADIIKSLEKAFDDYWLTELGWNNKRKKATNNIDWKATISKTIKFNLVWKPREPKEIKQNISVI